MNKRCYRLTWAATVTEVYQHRHGRTTHARVYAPASDTLEYSVKLGFRNATAFLNLARDHHGVGRVTVCAVNTAG